MIDVAETIAWFLGKETQKQLQESINNFNILLNDFKKEVEKISEEIWYDYNGYDYEYKLLATDEEINKTLEWLFKNKIFLREIYENILLSFKEENQKRIIIKKLFKEYLEDLAYESIEWEFEKWKDLNLRHSDLWNKTWKELQEIFKRFSVWLKSLDLWDNNLWNKTTWDELIEISKNLPAWLKDLNLMDNKLWNINLDELIEIFKSLPAWLKKLSLRSTKLWNKTWYELIEIFKNLPTWLKKLDLWNNNLWNKTLKELQEILISLPTWLKSLNLENNKLWDKTWEELQKAFPNIKINY